MKTQTNRILTLACATLFACIGVQRASATASISTLASASISADNTGGSYSTLTGPVLDEGANRDIGNAGSSTIILNAPSGFIFDTTATVTATVSRLAGAGTLLTLSSGTATVASGTITITVSARDQGDGSTRSRITWSGIRVRPSAGTPLASGNITSSGTANITGVSGSTSFGTLTETPGAANRLAFTTQPGGAVYKTAFTTQPVVRARDQFNNNTTNGLASSLNLTLTLSTGIGSLTGATTLDIGTTAGNGTATFSGLQIDRVENGDVITASATGLTSTNSSAFNVATRTLTVTGITANGKVYDRTTAATLNTGSAALSGVASGDSVTLDTSTATGTFSSANVGSRTASVAGLALTGTDAGSYTLTAPTTAAVAITALPVTISGPTASNKTYNGNTTATVSTSGATLSGVISGDTVTISGSATGTFSDKNVGTGKTVTFSGVTLSGAQGGNYSLSAQPTATANITPATLTITATAPDRVYDGTTNSTVTLTDNRVSGDSVTVTNSQAFFASKTVANNKTVTAIGFGISGGADAGNYVLGNASDTDTANITAKALTISGVIANDKIYDRTTTATLNVASAALVGIAGGDSITLNSGSATGTFSSSAVGSNKTVTMANFSITGTDAANYSLTQPTDIANITAKSLTVSGGSATSKTYNGNTAVTVSASGMALVGVVSGDTISVTLNTGGIAGTFADKHVGTSKPVQISGLTISGSASANYSLTQPTLTASITARALTITAIANTKIYDGTTSSSATPTVSSGTVQSGDIAAFIETFNNKNVGIAKTLTPSGVVTDGNSGANYTYTYVNSSAGVISTRAITVTAATDSKIYDGNNSSTATPTITTGAIQSGDTASFIQAFNNKNVGSGKTLTPSGSVNDGNSGANYVITLANNTTGSITVRSLAVSAAAANKVYDGNTTASVVLSDNRVSGDVVTVSHTSADFADVNVGAGKLVTVSGISLSGTDAANYSANTSATTNADITSVGLTITGLSVDNKVYDGNDTATLNTAGASLGGVVNPDVVTLDFSGASATFANKNVGNGKPVSHSGIIITGANAANYTLTQPSGLIANITPALLTATVIADNKVYDGTAAATLSTNWLAGVIGLDDVTSSGGTASFADKHAGVGKAVSVIGMTLNGGDAANYQLTAQPGTTADITVRDITVSATAASKVYDGNNSAPSTPAISSGSLAGGDIATLTESFDNKNVGSGKTVTPAGSVNDGNNGANYNVTFANNSGGEITVRALAISATAQDKVYDRTTTAIVTLSDNHISGDDIAASHTSANFTDANVGSGKTVNVNGISISGADAANYSANTSALAIANISAASLTASATVSNKAYDGTTVATIASRSLIGAIIPDDVTISGGSASFADKNVGSGKAVSITGLILGGADSANYAFASGSVNTTADITERALTMTATGVNKAYDRTNTASVTFTDDRINGDILTTGFTNAEFASINIGTNITISVSGITISGGDAANYSLASDTATTAADITQRTLTVSATAQNKVYDGNADATVSLSDDHIAGEDVTVTFATASFDNKNVGAAKPVTVSGISMSGADSGNYELASTTANSSADITSVGLTASATVNNKIYDGNNSATIASRSLTGVLGFDDVTLSGGSASFSDKDAGNGKAVSVTGMVLAGADAANYSLASGDANTTADIAARALIVSVSASNKVYDGNANALVALSDDRVGGDALIINHTTALFDNKNVGTAKPVSVSGISMTGTDVGNYNLANTSASGSANISARSLTVSAAAQNKVYDGNVDTTVALSDNHIVGDDIMISHTSASFDNKNVGTSKSVSIVGITMSGADSGNYELASTVSNSSANITPASLTGSITANNKVYDGNNTATIATRSLTGVIGSDDVSLSDGTATFPDKNIGNGKTVSAAGLSLSGSDIANYSLVSTSANTTADITPRSLVVSVATANKVYDGNAGATVTFSDDRISGDLLTVSHTAASFDDKNVGTAKLVNIDGVSMTGTDSGNYSLANNTATSSADITVRPLTVSAVASNKAYDGNADATVTLSDDRISGDVLTTSHTSASFDDKNVGTAKPVSIVGISMIGTDAGNYSLPNTTALSSADITARSLTVSAVASNKAYDGNADATVALSDDRINGDLLTISHTAALFDDKNVGVAKPVSVSGISMTGTDAGNYNLTSTTASGSADITARSLVVSAVASNKVYDGNANATVTLSDDRISGDVLTISHTSASFDNKNVGTAKPVSVSGISMTGVDAGNYNLPNTSASSSADITAIVLSASASANNKIYDGSTIATIASRSLSGVIGVDDVSLSGGSASFADKNVGNGKSVSVTGMVLGGADMANYSLASGDANTTADITATSLTVTADDKSRTYAAANPTLTGTITGLVPGDNITANYTTTADANSSVGNYPITPTLNDPDLNLGNYNVTTSNGTLTVAKVTLTVTANDATRSVGLPNQALTASYSGFLNGDTTGVLSGSPDINTLANDSSPVGTYPIVISGGTLSAANYNFAFVNGALTVTPVDYIFFDGFTRATDPGDLSPWQTNSGLWTVTGGELRGGLNPDHTYGYAYIPTNWGNYSVQARLSIPADGYGVGLGGRLDSSSGAHYAAWVYPEASLAGPNKLRLIKFSNWSTWTLLAETNLASVGTIAHTVKLTMNGTQISVDFDGTNMLAVTDSTLTSGGITADMWTDVTSYTMAVDDVMVVPFAANQTITFDALANKTYGDATFGVSATASSGLPVSFSIVSGPATISGTNITLTGAGGVTVRASQAGNISYNPAPGVDQSFNVGQLTVTGNITANNKVYDGNNNATILTRSLSGVIGSDDVSLIGGVATFDDKNVGNAKPVSATGLSLGGAQAASYILASSTASASADITAASLTGSITANNKVYDGNNSAAIATRSLSGVVGSDDVSLSGGTAAFTDKNVGAGKAVSSSGLSLSGTDAGNYTLASSGANTTADITERSLTVSAAASGKIYDGNANASVALSDDRIGGDLLTVNHTSALFDNKNVGTAKPVNVSGISIGGIDAGNYSLATTSASSSADITTASLTGSITADNKVYDGNNSATIASRSLAGVIGADDVMLIGGTATFADKNAGNSKAVSATGLSLSGANMGNYALASSSTVTTADITAAPLTVSAAADNKVYDGNNSATIGSRALTGVIGADDVTVSGGSAIFDTKNAGTGKPVAVTGMVLGGADMANYNLLSGDANTTADITARLLTVSAKASSKVYDGTAVATVMLSDDRISGDIVTTSETSASFDNKNVGASKPVSVLGISISGTDAGNYSLASTSASSSADITAMSLTAAATANNKVYDGDNSATIATRSLSGVIGSEDVTLSGGAATFDNKNVGNGKAVAVVGMILGGADISNYSLASGDATTTADITARSLTVTATAQSKVYDGNTNAVVSLSDNRISGDLLTVANGDQGFDDANVGSGRNVNIVGISISGADAGNYSLVNTTIVAGADITPVQLTVTADNKSRAYAAANPALTATFTGFVNSENSSVISGSADLNTAAETNSPVGAYPITAAIGSLSAANYTFRFVDGTLTITSYALTVTADDKNKVYGAANPALTGSIAGLQNGDNISANYATVADASSAVGSYPITVSLNDPDGKLGNYSVTTNEGTLSVSAALLTVTADDKNKVYGTANPAFTATLTGFVNGEDASVISGSADLATTATDSSPVGSHAITAAIGTLSAANYSFSFANGTLTITPASLTASATVANKVYDGNNIAMIVTRSLTGVIGSDDVSLSGGTATFANKNVGTAKPVTVVGMILGGADIANYSLANVSASSSADITARSLTVTATADNKVYDGNTNAIVHLADNRISGDVLTAANSDQGFDDANVGTAKNVNVLGISISGTDAGNYSLANTSAVATADITPVQLTVTADHKSKAYGSANPALTATFTGFVNSENSSVISGSADLSTAAETNSPVGTYPITAAIGSLSAANYTFSFLDGTLTITPYALTVSADNKARTYGATNPALTGSVSGLQNGDNISANYATVADTNSAVGGYPITVSLSDPDTKLGNYSVTTNEGTLTVSSALLTVTADDKTKVYGAVNPTLTSTITGYVNGENASILTGSPAISTLADASSPVGDHVITAALGTLSAANYAFNFVDGSLAITAASLTPNITAASKVYDGNTSAAIVTRSLSGVVGSDDVSLIGGTAIFSDKNVGVGKAVSATGLSMSGAAAGNYTLTSTTASTTADITVAPITVNGTAQNKIYDGTTAATIASISLAGVIAPDDVTVATAFANFEDKNVGSGKMVSITGLTLGGADMGNYELTSGDVTASADIMHAALSGSITANSKVYDGNTAAVIATRSLDNVIGLDDVNLVGGVASFQDKNVGNGKTVSATGLTLGGADAGNYSLASANAATSADITAAPLTASATAQNKVYDGNNTAIIATRSLGGAIGGDDVTISGGSASFDNKNVGTGKPVNVTGMVLGGADMGNYSLASGSANTTANITPVTLTVTADDASRNYGAANPSFTGTLAGVIGGDNISASYITIATPASPAGVYAITPSLNDPDSNLGNYTVTMNNGTLTIVGLAPSNIGSIEKQADGNMHIVVSGTPGQVYHLQAIGDLSGFIWSNISTNTANGSGVVEFDDLGATNHMSRFYRISTP